MENDLCVLLLTRGNQVHAVDQADWDAAYPACPAVPLAAHGGGRKKDQVTRQARRGDHWDMVCRNMGYTIIL